MRTVAGKTQFYDAFDHFFLVVESGMPLPDEVVVVPIFPTVFQFYKNATGRSLAADEDVRLMLCLDRIEEGLDRGLDLLEASRAEPNQSPLAVTRTHLERYLQGVESSQ